MDFAFISDFNVLVLSCFIRIYLRLYLFRQQRHPVGIASNSFVLRNHWKPKKNNILSMDSNITHIISTLYQGRLHRYSFAPIVHTEIRRKNIDSGTFYITFYEAICATCLLPYFLVNRRLSKVYERFNIITATHLNPL